MTLRGLTLGLSALLVAGAPFHGQADSSPPKLAEIYDLIRTNLPGGDAAEIEKRAVEGLLSAFSATVSLSDSAGDTAPAAPGSGDPVTKAEVFEGNIACLRIGSVKEGLPQAIRTAYAGLKATNKLAGLVLDLRYANGTDYAAAAAAADLFIPKDLALLNWGSGVVRSTAKNDAIPGPIAALVNVKTTGAAEALAALLREGSVALIIGAQTAGGAFTSRTLKVSTGQTLRIAAEPVTLGDGTPLPAKGLQPDIAVKVNPADERAYYADAFAVIPRAAGFSSGQFAGQSGTNRVARRPRMNEAELARERREGRPEAETTVARSPEPETPAVSDPVLARALDLLKGLAVVRGRN